MKKKYLKPTFDVMNVLVEHHMCVESITSKDQADLGDPNHPDSGTNENEGNGGEIFDIEDDNGNIHAQSKSFNAWSNW